MTDTSDPFEAAVHAVQQHRNKLSADTNTARNRHIAFNNNWPNVIRQASIEANQKLLVLNVRFDNISQNTDWNDDPCMSIGLYPTANYLSGEAPSYPKLLITLPKEGEVIFSGADIDFEERLPFVENLPIEGIKHIMARFVQAALTHT